MDIHRSHTDIVDMIIFCFLGSKANAAVRMGSVETKGNSYDRAREK